jgi:RHS repeat-associated protein
VRTNYLNLPTAVDFGSGNKIEWAYTVSGAKLRKTVYTNGAVTLTQDYVSGFVYKNGSLDFFSTETGRVKNQSGTLKYQYTLTDHLGNTRVMFEDNGGSAQLIEESHYYAFGMRIEGLSTTNPDNKFTYNGKELEDDHGLNWYHYGARFYDAQIGRWHVVDPVDELMSPYLFVKNNPVKFIDPDGKDVSIGKLLFENSEFRNWAENSFSFKLLVGLFGKGGPLEKYSVELNYFEPARTLKVPGRLDIMYNGKPLEIGAYTIDKEGNYSFVMRLNAGGEFWDKQGAKTGDHETSHLFYSTLQIVMGKKGDVKDIILLSGDRQHEEVAPGTEQSAALFDQILNTLGQDKANLPQGTVDQMKADGFIQVHDDRSGWQKFWDGVVSFFGGDSDNGQ